MLAAFLDGPATEFATGVRTSSLQVFWASGCGSRRGTTGRAGWPRIVRPWRAGRALGSPGRRCAAARCWPRPGIVDSGGIALLAAGS